MSLIVKIAGETPLVGLPGLPLPHEIAAALTAAIALAIRWRRRDQPSDLRPEPTVHVTEITAMTGEYGLFRSPVWCRQQRFLRRYTMLKRWTIVAEIETDLPQDELREECNLAGMIAGLGCWRPARKGCMGRFKVTTISPEEPRNVG